MPYPAPPDRNLLGDGFADFVGILPIDVAEQVIEALDDVRQLVDVGVAFATSSARRQRLDLRICIIHRHLQRRPRLRAIAVHIDGF